MKITIVRKLSNKKYFIDNRIQGKIFSWIHNYLKYFYLEHIHCIANDNSCLLMLPWWSA